MYAVLGSDGTVGGPGGSPLSSSVALISSPNVFRADADEHTPVTIIPHSQSQAADLFRVQNTAGSPLLEVSPTGRLTSYVSGHHKLQDRSGYTVWFAAYRSNRLAHCWLANWHVSVRLHRA